jgi:hypothetical protein
MTSEVSRSDHLQAILFGPSSASHLVLVAGALDCGNLAHSNAKPVVMPSRAKRGEGSQPLRLDSIRLGRFVRYFLTSLRPGVHLR